MVERDSLENCYTRKGIVGSNPTPSAVHRTKGNCAKYVNMEAHKIHLIKDLTFIFLSASAGIFITTSGLATQLLTATQEIELIGSFVAGLFFTSIFTISVSTAVLAGIASESGSILSVALLGAVGAVIGDLVIFNFIKGGLTEDLEFLIEHIKAGRLAHAFHFKVSKWLIPFLGALVIASPLPDELGISMMGFAKLKTPLFIAISFTFNFLGILATGLIARNFL